MQCTPSVVCPVSASHITTGKFHLVKIFSRTRVIDTRVLKKK